MKEFHSTDEFCDYIKAIEFLANKGKKFLYDYGWGNVIKIAKENGFQPRFNEPKQEWRPWKPSEVPIGKLCRINWGNPRWPFLITGVTEKYICGHPHHVPENPLTFHAALNNFEYSSDNGQTWNKCGVLE